MEIIETDIRTSIPQGETVLDRRFFESFTDAVRHVRTYATALKDSTLATDAEPEPDWRMIRDSLDHRARIDSWPQEVAAVMGDCVEHKHFAILTVHRVSPPSSSTLGPTI